eukprot:TRINITY_DN6765_c0_g1_i1.p1 TRINITY_DN6765_c0_g1~~TRINITY_DN6765_c0_g1_i1.p1  ORF type:complete len:345 (+),score=99.50 TRINITY_DN6765_c0_g1_i1:122-1036(+)
MSDKREESVRLMTYNIRYWNENESDKNNLWDNRKELVAKIIKQNSPQLIGLQEGIDKQMNDLFQFLILDTFRWEGVGRKDWDKENSGLESETSGVAFQQKRLERIDGGTFWLSHTPNQPSKFDHSDFNRVCTWMRLKDNLNDGKEFFLFNTHLDYSTRRNPHSNNPRMVRVDQMEVILKQIEIITSLKYPVFITGDWNTDLHPKDPLISFLESRGDGNFDWGMKNTEELSEEGHNGEEITYQGFGNEEWNDEWKPQKVDWIYLYQPKDGPHIRINRHVTCPDPPKERGTLPSDHRPLYIDFSFI